MFGAVFVDLILGVVVRNDDRGISEPRLLKTWVVWPYDDTAPGSTLLFRKLTAVHRYAVQIFVVFVRKAPVAELISHFVPPGVLEMGGAGLLTVGRSC